MQTLVKLRCLGGIVLGILVTGCVPEDPAAKEEVERTKAEAAAMRTKLAEKEQEIAGLQQQIETAKKETATVTTQRMPTSDEIEQKLSLETLRLRREAEKQLPGYKIREVKMSNLEIPSQEFPFSCRIAMVLTDPAGKPGQLFWTGKGDPHGNWTYQPASAPPEEPKPTPPTGDGGAVADNGSGDSPVVKPPTPKPPKPDPPKPEPPPVRHDPLQSAARQGGAMPANQTFIIDLNKLQPLNIKPGSHR